MKFFAKRLLSALLLMAMLFLSAVAVSAAETETKADESGYMVKNITVSGGEFTTSFKGGHYLYSVYMKSYKETIGISVELTDDRFEYSVKGNSKLSRSDDNVVTVHATDPEGKLDDEIYTLNIFFEARGLTYLDAENGVMSPQFDKFHTTYYITLSNNIDTFEKAQINWTTVNKDDVVEVIAPDTLNADGTLPAGQRSEYKLVVTDKNGDIRSYKLKLYRKDSGTSAISDGCLLSSITINGGRVDISNFRQKQSFYDVTVPKDIKKLEIEASPVNKSNLVEVIGNTVMQDTEPNYITIVVTSDKTGARSYYTLRCQYDTLLYTEKYTDMQVIAYAGIAVVFSIALGIGVGLMIKRKRH